MDNHRDDGKDNGNCYPSSSVDQDPGCVAIACGHPGGIWL